MPVILSYIQPPDDVLAFMKEHAEVRVVRPKKERDRFYRELAEADALYGAGLEIDEELLQHAPNLKVISNVSVGYDNLNMKAISEKGVTATHTPTVLIDTMADTMIGLMIATARRIPELDHMVKSGSWKKPLTSEHFGTNIHHKKLGIIGMGRIGEETARRARAAFHMDVVYHNRSRKPEAEHSTGASYAELDNLLHSCDFIMLLTPLTEQTRGLIGAEEFGKMQKHAIFLNGSRGPVAVEEEMIQALQDGEIAAAGLDVFENEPIEPDHPFLQMDNVVTLPHIGTATHETRHAMAADAARQCVDGVLGKKPKHVIPGGK
ncbi:2-hydroxyacid dehydrogenase [Salibacterium aidingense]|uniref:2-hydroxyacid dehydrogenase n=1 Tax=Salibacterium aidingense TaxID=384933 RepID=UPI0004165E8B|nr:D-glycerate dehydrogenase [Salibacterium aidingense]